MELVDPLEVLGLAQQHQVSVPARPNEREGAEQVTVGEVLAGGDEFALVLGAAFLVQPAPGRVDFQEGVFDEMSYRHEPELMIRTPAPLNGGRKIDRNPSVYHMSTCE